MNFTGGLLIAAISLAATAAFGGGPQYDCRSGLLDQVFDRVVGYGEITEPIDFHPRSKRVRLVYKVSGGRTPRLNAAVEARTAEMAEEGYMRQGGVGSMDGPRLELTFRRDPRLLSRGELTAEPAWVGEQRAKFHRKFPLARFRDRLYASRKEKYETEAPDGKMVLTAKTLGTLEPGLYSFVRVTGENFLRLGSGHHIIGAGRVAMSAGDVSLIRDAESGQVRVEFLSPRSDTYRPPEESLLHALEALWRQGIYPRPVKILEWNNRDLILDLSETFSWVAERRA